MSCHRDGISDFLPVDVDQSGASPPVGVIVDTQGYNALAFVLVQTGAGAAGWTIEHGDASNLSDATAADATDYIEDSYGTGSAVHKLSYIGNKRYVRVTHSAAGALVALKRNPSQEPA